MSEWVCYLGISQAADRVLEIRLESEQARQRVMTWARTCEESSHVVGVAVTTLWRKRGSRDERAHASVQRMNTHVTAPNSGSRMAPLHAM
jgi:hypothetical protein